MKLQRLFVLLICLLACVLAALVYRQPVYAQQSAPQQPADGKALARMWIDMGLNDQLVDWFNQNARPDDIARADNIRLIDLLGRVRVGRRCRRHP